MHSLRNGSKALIREINESLVLQAVRAGDGVSRTDIARASGLSLPTVSGITAAMLERGLLEERDRGPSAGGRRPVLLALRPDAGHVVGVKLTETQVVAVLTDLDGTVVHRTVVDTVSTTVEAVVDAVAEAVRQLRARTPRGPVLGIGLGMAGVVEPAGLVRHATYANWGAVDLGGAVEAATDLPTLVDNDVNALVAREQWFGAGRGVSDFVVVSIGRGIGLGLVMGGRLQRGARGGAGELGHVKVRDGGPVCACGSHGCLEAVAALPALTAALADRLPPATPADPTAVLDLVRSGDRSAARAFADAGAELGRAVGNVVNVVDPSLVVLTGEAVGNDGPLETAFDAALRATAFSPLVGDLDVVLEPLGDDAWAQGAASLLLGDLFSPRLRTQDSGRPSLAVS